MSEFTVAIGLSLTCITAGEPNLDTICRRKLSGNIRTADSVMQTLALFEVGLIERHRMETN